jgi:hypothetical protein
MNNNLFYYFLFLICLGKQMFYFRCLHRGGSEETCVIEPFPGRLTMLQLLYVQYSSVSGDGPTGSFQIRPTPIVKAVGLRTMSPFAFIMTYSGSS